MIIHPKAPFNFELTVRYQNFFEHEVDPEFRTGG